MPLRGPRRRDHDVVGRRHQQAHLHRLVRIGLGLGLGLGLGFAFALALALGLPPTGVPLAMQVGRQRLGQAEDAVRLVQGRAQEGPLRHQRGVPGDGVRLQVKWSGQRARAGVRVRVRVGVVAGVLGAAGRPRCLMAVSRAMDQLARPWRPWASGPPRIALPTGPSTLPEPEPKPYPEPYP